MVLVQYQIATSMSMIMNEDLECHIFTVMPPPPALGERVSDISVSEVPPAAEWGVVLLLRSSLTKRVIS